MINFFLLFFGVCICGVMAVSVGNCLLCCRIADNGTDINKPGQILSSIFSPEIFSGKTSEISKSQNKRVCVVTGGNQSVRFFEYSGAIHIHTVYSDGGGTYEDIINAADSLGLDFIIPTDHNTLAPIRDGWARKAGGVIVIPGVENAINHSGGHYIAIGDSLTMVRTKKISSEIVYKANVNNNNMIFPAHIFRSKKDSWKNFNIGGYTGIEIFNLDENWRDNLKSYRIQRFFANLFVYCFINKNLNYLISFPQKQLEKFDELNMVRKTSGIGSTDAHSRKIFSRGIPSYTSSFKSVQTIIITRVPFNGQYSHDREIVLNAIRNGNSFVGFPGFGNVRGFLFTAFSDSSEASCGDSLCMGKSAKLRIVLPENKNCVVRIVRNGRIFKEYDKIVTKIIDLDISDTGVYRVQVLQKRDMLPLMRKRFFPWILSNPVYIYKKK